MSLLPSRGPDASASQDGELQIVGVDEDVASVLDALSSETARNILNAVYEEPGTPSELADRLDMSIQKVSYHLEKLESEELIAVAGTQYSEKGQEMTVYEPPEEPLVVFVGTPDRKRTLRSFIERLVPAIGLLTAASVMIQVVFGKLPGLFGSPESPGDTGAEPGVGGANETGTATPDATPDAEPTPTPEPQPTENDSIGIQEATPERPRPETTEPPAETETPEPSTPEPSTTEPSTPVEMAGEATETVTAVASGGGVALEPGVAFFLGGLLGLAAVGLTWAYTG